MITKELRQKRLKRLIGYTVVIGCSVMGVSYINNMYKSELEMEKKETRKYLDFLKTSTISDIQSLSKMKRITKDMDFDCVEYIERNINILSDLLSDMADTKSDLVYAKSLEDIYEIKDEITDLSYKYDMIHEEFI